MCNLRQSLTEKCLRSIQEKMNEAVNKSQKELNNKPKRGSDATYDTTGVTSAYLSQKSEHLRMAGSKGEDVGNWLVR